MIELSNREILERIKGKDLYWYERKYKRYCGFGTFNEKGEPDWYDSMEPVFGAEGTLAALGELFIETMKRPVSAETPDLALEIARWMVAETEEEVDFLDCERWSDRWSERGVYGLRNGRTYWNDVISGIFRCSRDENRSLMDDPCFFKAATLLIRKTLEIGDETTKTLLPLRSPERKIGQGPIHPVLAGLYR